MTAAETATWRFDAKSIMRTVWFGRMAEFAVIFVLAVIVHALVLRFIFPGFYDPFWPNHSDHYIAAEFAHTPTALSELIGLPRPVSYLFFYLTGLFGTRRALVCDLGLVMANCALTIMFVRRFAGQARSGPFLTAATVYLFLIFAHPVQYVWSTYDVFSQVSYFLILVGLALAWTRKPWPAQLAVFALAFLAKETYILSLLLFLGAWRLTVVGEERRTPARAAGAALGGFVIALAYSKVIGSEYLGRGASALSPYHIDLSPLSILREWLSFAAESGPALWVCVILFAAAAALTRKRSGLDRGLPVLALAAGGLLAWLPNCLLPNHHMAGYSWNGAYLLFTPLLLLAPLWTRGRRVLFIAMLLLGLLAPIGLRASYDKNQWSVAQQRRQKALMFAVTTKIRRLAPQTRSVLVTGLDFPFGPFDHPRTLFEFKGGLPAFDVVIYEPKEFTRLQQPTHTRWLTPQAASRQRYDEVWMFGEDGAAIEWTLSAADRAALSALGLDPASLPLYPAVGAALGVNEPRSGPAANLDGLHLLACGTAYLDYHQFQSALKCLNASKRSLPGNPYPYFFSGQAEDNIGDTTDAIADFSRAVALDDRAHPNLAFKPALARARTSASGAGSEGASPGAIRPAHG